MNMCLIVATLLSPSADARPHGVILDDVMTCEIGALDELSCTEDFQDAYLACMQSMQSIGDPGICDGVAELAYQVCIDDYTWCGWTQSCCSGCRDTARPRSCSWRPRFGRAPSRRRG